MAEPRDWTDGSSRARRVDAAPPDTAASLHAPDCRLELQLWSPPIGLAISPVRSVTALEQAVATAIEGGPEARRLLEQLDKPCTQPPPRQGYRLALSSRPRVQATAGTGRADR